MFANKLSTIPAGLVGAGLPVPGGVWGLLGSEILAASGSGTNGAGLGVNDDLTPSLRYVYALESRGSAQVRLFPDSSHEGPVPYSGVIRLYEQGTGEVTATQQARSFSVSAAAPAPSITTHPANQSVVAGGQATFSVVATGTGLSYQWQRGGVNIVGATQSTLTVTTVLSDNGAQFRVVVSNSGGSVNSNSATLTVTAAVVPPQITAGPQPVSVQAGGTANFSVTATGTAPLSYQWRLNGSPIAGAPNAATYSRTVSSGDNGALISVAVSNASNTTAVSNGAAITITSSAPLTGPASEPTIVVPRGSWRRLVRRVSKQPSESRDEVISLEEWFAGRSDLPASISVVQSSQDLVVTAVLSGQRIGVVFAGGASGGTYNVSVRLATTSNPPIVREFDFFVAVEEVN